MTPLTPADRLLIAAGVRLLARAYGLGAPESAACLRIAREMEAAQALEEDVPSVVAGVTTLGSGV